MTQCKASIRIGMLLLMLFVCTTEHLMGQTKYADNSSYLIELVSALEKEWPENKTINIVCHGHSVPAGYHKTPAVRPFESYPHLLHVALKERFPHAVLNVIVTAIGGEHSVAGAKRFSEDVLSLSPDLILIDYGLNDRRAGLEPAALAWQEMIQKSKEANIPVILLTPTADQKADMLSDQDVLSQHAEQIRMLARKNKIGLADSYAAVVEYLKSGNDITSIMSQVNHPNRQGHEMVVEELLKWFPE